MPILITECGISLAGGARAKVTSVKSPELVLRGMSGMRMDVVPTLTNSLDDGPRIQYLMNYMRAAAATMSEGVALRGFFVWSLLDNFEWSSGYTQTFGLVHVNRSDPLYARTNKASADWLARSIDCNCIAYW